MTDRHNRTLLRRALGVGAALALMGGALPAAWAEPGEEATNQDAGAEAVDAEGAAGGDDLLVTIPGNHNKAMGCDADWAPDCAKAALLVAKRATK